MGAFLLVLLRRNTEDLIEGKEILAPAIFGAALIAIVYVLPEGVVGGVRRLLARLGPAVRRRSADTSRRPASASDVPNDSINSGGSHEERT